MSAMSLAGWAFDVSLAVALPLVAWRALAARDLTQAVVLFISFGLLVALCYVRLDAPDLALAEAAIGAGITGVLFLNTLGALGAGGSSGERGGLASRPGWSRAPLALAVTGLGGFLAFVAFTLPEPQVRLARQVGQTSAGEGVTNPVTEVLLNFRSYDTLLEVGVLLLAVIATWSLGLSRYRPGRLPTGGTDAPVLYALVRLLTPVALLVGAYLLYAGTEEPGGAFQSGAVLGALGVLLLLANLVRVPTGRSGALRIGLAAGFGFFLVLGTLLLLAGNLLEYPPGYEYYLIVAVEVVIAVSIALTLMALFLAAPPGEEAGAESEPGEEA